MELNAKTIVKAVSDVYSPGDTAFIFAPEDSRWIDYARETIETVEDIVIDDPYQETHPTKLEGVPLHPRPRPEEPGKMFVNSPEMLDQANLLIFIEQVPDNLELPETKAVHLFVSIKNEIIVDNFPYLKDASPDLADPQFIADGWVSSIREGYCYYGYRKGSAVQKQEPPNPKPEQIPIKSDSKPDIEKESEEGSKFRKRTLGAWVWLGLFLFIVGFLIYNIGTVNASAFDGSFIPILVGLGLTLCSIILLIMKVDLEYKNIKLNTLNAGVYCLIFSIQSYAINTRFLGKIHEAAVDVNQAALEAGIDVSTLDPERILQVASINNAVLLLFMIMGCLLIGHFVWKAKVKQYIRGRNLP